MAFTNPFTPTQINSPGQANRTRQIAAALMSQGKPTNWAEGLGALTGAFAGNQLMGRADEAERLGQDSVAAALAGLGPNSSFEDVSAALSNPWLANSPGGSAVANALLNSQMQQADPYRQLQMRQAQLDYDQDLAGGQLAGETFFGNPVPIQTPNGIAYGQLGNQGSFNIPELPEGYNFLSPVQQLNTGTEFTGVDKFGNPVGVTAPINNIGAEQDKAIGSGLGEQSVAGLESGRVAAANNAKLEILEQTLATAPQGAKGAFIQAAGSIGIPMEGLDDIQAAQAIINQMVPLQRPPGSGTMSDADLALFKQSLPSIINQPGANQRIIGTLRAINDYTIAQTEIERQVISGQIDRATADRLQKSIPNPLQNFNKSAASGITIRRIE